MKTHSNIHMPDCAKISHDSNFGQEVIRQIFWVRRSVWNFESFGFYTHLVKLNLTS